MGCCQTRDEDKPVFKTKLRDGSAKLETIDSENLVPSGETTDRSEGNGQSLSLLSYAETCYSHQRWEMLAPLLTVSLEIQKSYVCVNWAEKPKTVSSVALVYLGQAVQKYTVQVSPYIEVFLPIILVFLKSGSNDQKELSLFLLHSYIDFASEKAVSKLLDSGIFHLVAKNMISIKAEMRKFSANLCYKLYRNRLSSKELFIKADGVFFLMQMIGWSSLSDSLEELIKYLEEVVLDSDKYLILENLNATRELKTLDILEKLDLSSRSFELRSSVERLIRFYRSAVEPKSRASI